KLPRMRAGVAPRRRVNQRLQIGAKRFRETGCTQLNRGIVGGIAAPSPVGQSWQTTLKRNLSERLSRAAERRFAAICAALLKEPDLMVNNSFPKRSSGGPIGGHLREIRART